jgi:hypothetical protein
MWIANCYLGSVENRHYTGAIGTFFLEHFLKTARQQECCTIAFRHIHQAHTCVLKCSPWTGITSLWAMDIAMVTERQQRSDGHQRCPRWTRLAEGIAQHFVEKRFQEALRKGTFPLLRSVGDPGKLTPTSLRFVMEVLPRRPLWFLRRPESLA